MPDRIWYYASGGQQRGPLKTAKLKQLATAGELRPTDLVWTDSMANWAPASSVKGLFPVDEPTAITTAAAPQTAEPPAPASEAVILPTPQRERAEQLPVGREFAKRAWLESAGAVRSLISDPWGRVGTVYEQLGAKRAIVVGGVFVAAFLVCCLLAAAIKQTPLPGIANVDLTDAATFFKTLIVLVGYVGTLVGAVTLFRVATRTGVEFAADLFVVGAALLPLGGYALVASLLDWRSAIIQWLVSVLFAFTAITGLLMLYNGLSKAVRLSDRMSALAVPAVIAAAMTVAQLLAWLLTRA
ncbi:MAG: DUF4339 domain-containing protein [Pirellulales bacterium]